MNDLIEKMDFDYGDLPAEKVLECETAFQMACTIENQATRMIGEQFAKARNNLKFLRGGNGWQEWCKAKLNISITQAHNYINEFENGESIKLFYTFGKTARWLLAAPTMPQDVRDQASDLAEKGEDVSIKTIKQLKADYEAKQSELETEKRRCNEWREQNKANHDKIKSLELDLLAEKNKPIPEPEIKTVEKIPDDYEAVKDKAAKIEQELKELKKEQARLVDDQVKSKLNGYQDEVNRMENRKSVLQEQVDRMKSYMDSLNSEAKLIEVHQAAIEKSRLELISLAAFLNDLDPINDAGTIKKWRALADMHQTAADSINSVFSAFSEERGLRIAA